MDTLTHIVLGACIGEVLAGKQLGKKALLLGAIAQNIPDIDFVASFWLPVSSDVLAHRGFTHSFVFTILASLLLAWVSTVLFSKNGMGFKKWLLFWLLQLFIHIFIDAFNVYGTGWFEPFSHYRVTFNTMFVADPFFSIWPAIALVVLLVVRTTSKNRKKTALAAICLSAIYLLSGIVFKSYIARAAENALHDKGIVYSRYFTTPAPLNNLLWYIVAENDSGYYIGYRSMLDHKSGMNFHYVPRNKTLLQPFAGRKDVRHLLRFSDGYYAMQVRNDTVIFNDLRFEEIAGWPEPKANFVFHYYLQYPDDNKMVVQRGRFAQWNLEVLKAFIRRVGGITH